MSRELRINYARLWLALISPSSPKVDADRRKYAYAAGNIDESLYPIFQAAITGRAALENAIAEDGGKPKSMMDLGESFVVRSRVLELICIANRETIETGGEDAEERCRQRRWNDHIDL